MKHVQLSLWTLLTALVAFLPGGVSAPQPADPVPLNLRLDAEQARLDRLARILCEQRTSDVCRAIDDEQVALKELRGEIADYDDSRGKAPERNQIERDLAKLRDEVASLERNSLRLPAE